MLYDVIKSYSAVILVLADVAEYIHSRAKEILLQKTNSINLFIGRCFVILLSSCAFVNSFDRRMVT